MEASPATPEPEWLSERLTGPLLDADASRKGGEMQREEIPDPATQGGLSTDDFVQPRDPITDDAADTQSDVPTFPGEATTATGKPAADEAGAADSGTQGTGTQGTQGTQAETTGAGSGAQSEFRASNADDEDVPQLLTTEDEDGFRARWQDVQSKFVDDPRDAVHAADTLVADVMQRLAATFADHKQELEGQWNRGEQANTEDLRLALRHYRSFFNRLLVT